MNHLVNKLKLYRRIYKYNIISINRSVNIHDSDYHYNVDYSGLGYYNLSDSSLILVSMGKAFIKNFFVEIVLKLFKASKGLSKDKAKLKLLTSFFKREDVIAIAKDKGERVIDLSCFVNDGMDLSSISNYVTSVYFEGAVDIVKGGLLLTSKEELEPLIKIKDLFVDTDFKNFLESAVFDQLVVLVPVMKLLQ